MVHLHSMALHCITLHVFAASITVLPYGRQEYDCMEGRAPLERQHTRHCTTSSGQMGPVLASSWGHRSTVGSVMVQAVGTVSQFAYYIETKTRFYPIHICLIFLMNYYECKYVSAGRVSVS